MRWGFIVDITGSKGNQITQKVLLKATGVASSLPSVGGSSNTLSYKASIIFFQSSDRWLKGEPETPREDRGDLDNMIKLVIDGLGPIIGYRWDWKNNCNSDKPSDSKILELFAKKVNSGSLSEMVSVEVETLT